MPQYLMSVWHDTDVDFTSPEFQRQVARVSAVNAEIEAAGAWVFGGDLHAASSATVVRSSGGAVSMIDGPYAETKSRWEGSGSSKPPILTPPSPGPARQPPPVTARSRCDPSKNERAR